jgi:hypothetical protein
MFGSAGIGVVQTNPLCDADQMNRQRYERAIQFLGVAAAVVFAVGGAGIVVDANLHIETGACVFLVTILVSAFLLALLILEQLASVWFTTQRGRISMAGLKRLTPSRQFLSQSAVGTSATTYRKIFRSLARKTV